MDRYARSQELLLIGERIRSQRMRLCMSQEVLAEKIGISANTVSRIEGGQMSMGIGIFIKLVQALDTDANDLLGIIPEVDKRQYWDIVHHIGFLGEREQGIVLRIVETLVESLRQVR